MVAVSFASENPLGECPGEMEGDVSKTTRGLIVLQVGLLISDFYLSLVVRKLVSEEQIMWLFDNI